MVGSAARARPVRASVFNWAGISAAADAKHKKKIMEVLGDYDTGSVFEARLAERLTAAVEIAGGGGEKKPPYSFEEARSRLVPMLQSAAAALDALPEKACPNGQAVASLTVKLKELVSASESTAVFSVPQLWAVQ